MIVRRVDYGGRHNLPYYFGGVLEAKNNLLFGIGDFV